MEIVFFFKRSIFFRNQTTTKLPPNQLQKYDPYVGSAESFFWSSPSRCDAICIYIQPNIWMWSLLFVAVSPGFSHTPSFECGPSLSCDGFTFSHGLSLTVFPSQSLHIQYICIYIQSLSHSLSRFHSNICIPQVLPQGIKCNYYFNRVWFFLGLYIKGTSFSSFLWSECDVFGKKHFEGYSERCLCGVTSWEIYI